MPRKLAATNDTSSANIPQRMIGEESTPLLPDTETSAAQNDLRGAASQFVSHLPFRLSKVAMYCLLLNFLLEIFDMTLITPQIALYQRSICFTYYKEHQPDLIEHGTHVREDLCHVNAVQQELAIVRGLKGLFDSVAVLLMAIPTGYLADRLGRRKVMAFILSGMLGGVTWIILVCSMPAVLPIRLVWLSSFFYLCGGGYWSASIMILAIASDTCPEADRSRTFYHIYSTYLFTELIAPSIASLTMDFNLMIPFVIGIVSLSTCFPVLYLMPETIKASEPASQDGRRDSEDSENSGESLSSSATPETNRNDIMSILKSRKTLQVMPIFFIGTFRVTTLNVLLQYTTVRFGWKLSKTNVLISEVAIVNIFLFLFVLPALTSYLSRRMSTPASSIDLFIARGSLIILFTGSMLLGLAPSVGSMISSLVVFAAGFGARVSTLSLLTAWVTPELRGRTYGIVAVAENLGVMVGEPMLQTIFASSLDLLTFWLGTPFFCSAFLYALAAVCALSIRLKPLTSEPGQMT